MIQAGVQMDFGDIYFTVFEGYFILFILYITHIYSYSVQENCEGGNFEQFSGGNPSFFYDDDFLLSSSPNAHFCWGFDFLCIFVYID
jgi:hypothetical protein